MQLAPVSFEVVRSLYMLLTDLQQSVVDDLFDGMRTEARRVLRGAGQVGDVVEKREAYMRYVGQGYEVAVDISGMQVLAENELRECFEAVYQQLYGRTIPGMAVEILGWTLSLSSEQTESAHVVSRALIASP